MLKRLGTAAFDNFIKSTSTIIIRSDSCSHPHIIKWAKWSVDKYLHTDIRLGSYHLQRGEGIERLNYL